MIWKNILNFNNIKLIVSSILISGFMILALKGYLPSIYTPFERELMWLNFAIPIIFITAILNRGNNLKNAILKGVFIGIFGWVILLIYYYFDEIINSTTSFGFFIAFFMYIFLPLLLISSIVGLVISFYIRRQLEKRKKTLK